MTSHARLASALALAATLALSGVARADAVTVAVSYFDNTAKDEALAPLAKGIADMLVTDLAVSPDLRVVERERLQQVLAEITLQKQPYFDKASAARLGRGLGAAYLVTGAYLAARKQLRIDVRVVDVESAEIVFTAKETGALDEFFAVQRALGEKILVGLGAKLTLIQKKKLGQDGTRSYEAFGDYCDALDARDRGDAQAERVALRKALAADPNYARVKRRLDALEKRVAALEKSGGRIIRPTTAREFFHNARIQKGEGDYAGALASLREAARREPALADVWLLAAELQPGAPFARDVIRDAELRGLVTALQDRDARALDAALAKAGRHRALAAAFLFALVRDRLPAKSLDVFAMARRAAREILAAEKEGRLSAAFIDHLPLLASVRLADGKYFGARGAAQIDAPAAVTIRDQSEQHARKSWWRVRASLGERPASAVEVTIERDRSHPHWAQKPPLPGRHAIFVAYMRDRAKASRAWDEAKNPAALIYDLADWNSTAEHDGQTLQIGKLGDRIAVPPGWLRCGESDDMLTGAYCTADVFVHKAGLPPGFYVVTLRYADPDGVQVSRVVKTWAGEFSLVPHHLINYPGKKRIVTFLHPRDAAERKKKIVSKRAFTPESMVLVQTYYATSTKRKGDIEHIYFDLDYKLSKGAAPGGQREWMAYRDRILRDGYKAEAYGDQTYLPLPPLAEGAHWLCMATVRSNGSVTPEAECLAIEIARPR